MGSCFSTSYSSSSSTDLHNPNSAFVISVKGDLRRYPTPATVSQVLQSESSPSNFFICNSDNLYYDDYIQPLDSQHELDAGQIYFILPISKLHYRLSASDMAALAVKASVALNTTTTTVAANSNNRRTSSKTKLTTTSNQKIIGDHTSTSTSSNSSNPQINMNGVGQKRKNKSRISPFVFMETSQINIVLGEDDSTKTIKNSAADPNSKQPSTSTGMSRSGSIRKLQRFSSRRTRLAVRSFRLRLSTIYEGSDQQLQV